MRHFVRLFRNKMAPSLRAIIGVVSILLVVNSHSVLADEYHIYGPEIFVRDTASPVHEIRQFSGEQGSDYLLRVRNGFCDNETGFLESILSLLGLGGDECTAPVRIASRILINGEVAVSSLELLLSGSHIEKNISLSSNNTLVVEINGFPGRGLSVEVLALDGDGPEITASTDPEPNANGWFNTDVTVSFSCADSGSGIQSCSSPVVVTDEGANQLVTGTAINNVGASATAEVTVNLDKTSPVVSFANPVNSSVLLDRRPNIEISGSDNLALDTGSLVLAANGSGIGADCTWSGNTATCVLQNDLPLGPVSLSSAIVDLAGNSVAAEVSLTIAADSDGDGVIDEQDQCPGTPAGTEVDDTGCEPGGQLPPEPEEVASPIDTTGTSSLKSTTEFLYTGTNPIQTGVDPETIEERRASVIRGAVRDKENNPLPGVTITIKDHPELGQTVSRESGGFDMAVNGGGYLVINYEKEGFLPAQRRVKTPWNDYTLAEDVVLIPLDSQVTNVDLTDSSQSFQIHQGSLQTDEDGSRQATILFPAGTTATMTLPGGSVTSIDELSVRATEYTVGENGPETMPGQLPPSSGYTYAVELSVDQAIAASATRVDFSQPLPVYVDNFLEFPAGTIVPAGWYDREKAAWIPSDNGVVVEIIDVVDGLAELDVDGSGVAADAVVLSDLGITDAERQQLAQLYEVGKSLWRVPTSHFTPWDHNWPYGPPEDAEPPEVLEPEADEPDPDPECESGSVIECQGQVLREEIPIVGTPFSLNYRSDTASGRSAHVDVPLTGNSLPSSVLGVLLEIRIAGKKFTYKFDPQLNLNYRFIWDGHDSYDRALVDSAKARIRVGYVYPAVYYEPDEFEQAFARFGDSELSRSDGQPATARRSVVLWKSSTKHFKAPILPGVENFGSWTLSENHRFNNYNHVLSMGNGQVVKASVYGEIIDRVINTCAGTCGIDNPAGIDFGEDGHIYIASGHGNQVFKVDHEGNYTVVAGNRDSGFSGDGGQAADALLKSPIDVIYDGGRGIYVVDSGNHRIRLIDRMGTIKTVAGSDVNGFSGDGGPAIGSALNSPNGIVLGPDGSLYIADSYNHRIRKIDPQGNISTVAGSGPTGVNAGAFGGDNSPANEARLNFPTGVALDLHGNLYIADSKNHRIRRVAVNGIITTVAGTGERGLGGDGGPAVDAKLNGPWDVAVDKKMNIYVSDSGNNRIRHINPQGIMLPVAGREGGGKVLSGVPAIDALVSEYNLAFGEDDALYLSKSSLFGGSRSFRIRRISNKTGMAFGERQVSSPDGRKIFVFDTLGRHLETVDSISGETEYRFIYDEQGNLKKIIDAYENITTIERDADGYPVAIISPDEQRTSLALDSNGYLSSVVNPAGESYQMSYSISGLLLSFTDANQNSSNMTYDELGYLTTDINAAGGGWTLSRSKLVRGNEYRMTSAEGRTSIYQVFPDDGNGLLKVTTYADGSEKVTNVKKTGEKFTSQPNGTELYQKWSADPRFGMNSPVLKSAITTTPSGLEMLVEENRYANLQVKENPLSHRVLRYNVGVNGRWTSREYTATTNTWNITSPEGRETTVQNDGSGRPVSQQSGGLASLGFDYDSRGRLTESTIGTGADQRSVSYSYGSDGFLESITDTLLRTTSFDYDLAGRVTRQTYHNGRSVGYQYDPAGNLTAITPPGREAHIFSYTDVNLEEDYTPPDLDGAETVTSYQYNKDKQLTLVQRPDGRDISYGYDDGGRLARRTIGRGSYGYTYDDNTGQLSTITAPDGTLSYTYDGFLTLSETWGGTIAGSVSWGYDNNFWLTEQCVNTDDCVSFDYDQDGLLTQAGDLSLTRDAQSGLLEDSSLGNISTDFGYNSFGELLSAEAEASGSPLASFGYQRDSLGRIDSKTETLDGSTVVESYEYDTVGRLKSVTRDGETSSWQYDSNGNRTHENGQLVATYDEQDRLLTYKEASYSYTTNGELQSKTESGVTTSYSYDEFGNLISVDLPGDVQIEYLIDGRDRRIGKKVNGQLAQGFLYEGQLNPVAELDGSGNIVSRFVYGEKANVPAYMIKGGATYRIISDHLGTPRLVVNVSTGVIAQRMDYDAWGNVLLDTNPGFQPFGFAGGIYDLYTGFTRFGTRDYDAETGRWTAKDSIGFLGGDTNLYGYVVSDPVNLADPSGRIIFSVAGAIIGAVASGAMAAADGQSPSSIMKQAAIGALTGAFNPASAVLRGALALAGEAASQAVSDDFTCEGFNSAGLLTAGLLGSRGGHPEAGTPFREALNDAAPGDFAESTFTTLAGEL